MLHPLRDVFKGEAEDIRTMGITVLDKQSTYGGGFTVYVTPMLDRCSRHTIHYFLATSKKEIIGWVTRIVLIFS